MKERTATRPAHRQPVPVAAMPRPAGKAMPQPAKNSMPTGKPTRETNHYQYQPPEPQPKPPADRGPLAPGARRDMNLQIQANRNVDEDLIRQAIVPGDNVQIDYDDSKASPEVQFTGDLSRESIDNIHDALYEKRAHHGASWNEE